MIAYFAPPRLLAAAGVLCMVLAGGQDAKRYDGRSLDEWRELIQEIDYQSPSRAEAVPGLRQIIRDADVPWFTRRQAALTLGRIGEPARAAVDDLVELLAAPVDPVETTPPLWSLKALALFGPLATKAAPAAIDILRDAKSHQLLRLTATETLARIGIASRAGLRALIEGGAGQLETANSADQLELRIACIEGLQLSAPPSAVPMLMAACEDTSGRVRHAAASTLGFLGARAEGAAELLGALVVFDDTPVVRETAARSLAQLGEPGIPILQRLLANDDRDVVVFAVDAAGRTVTGRRGLEASLRPLFASGDAEVAARAMNAWWRVTRTAGPIVQPLVRFLENEDRDVRKVAADTLILMGPAATPARQALERMAVEGSEEARAAARRVLRSLPESSETKGLP